MVRIWSVPVAEFDRQHLLGEHAELHCIVGALQGKYKGFSHHPETLRFKNRLEELYFRHDEQVQEMRKRGYNHNTPLPKSSKVYTYTHEEYKKDHAELMKRQMKQISWNNQQSVKQSS